MTKAIQDSVIRVHNDSLAREKSGFGIVLEDPYYVRKDVLHKEGVVGYNSGMSWIYAVLAILFCLVCFKSRSTPRYVKQLMANLTETRIRHNVFDNTVRESSFMFVLNIGWVLCAGILLWCPVAAEFTSETMSGDLVYLEGIGICVGIAGLYKLVMNLGYLICGNIFTDSRAAAEWVKGANSESGLELLLLFPLSLVSLCYQEFATMSAWIGLGIVIIGKLLFIYKGLRIFLRHFASFLLFLYYLCSLEIIPLYLGIAGAVDLCRALLGSSGFMTIVQL